MRAWMMAAAAALALAGPAAAQTQDFSGAWAFQTAPYGDEQFGVIMSGAAVVTRAARGRYAIRLVSNERIIDRATGRSQMVTARQACIGELAGAQFNITCELAEPTPGYEPDNFVLQRVEDPNTLNGVLSSAASAEVTFTRVR